MSGRTNIKKVETDTSSLVKKSNEMTLAQMSHGLSMNEMQLLAYAIYVTQKDNATSFIKADFERQFGMERYVTKRASQDSKRLRSLGISTENLQIDEFDYLNVFQRISYKKGTFSFKWTEDILPHILDIQGKYILTDLTLVSKFNSSFSWVLYEYLKAKYGCWYTTFTKDEIIELFGIEKTSSYMSNTGLLKKKVLDMAVKEINEHTELEVSYEDIKEGRSIVGFKILWSRGKTVSKATKSQMDTLCTMLKSVFKDTLMYAEIENEINRKRALSVVKDLTTMKETYFDGEVGMTSELYTELLESVTNKINILNGLVEVEDPALEVPMFDWLNN